MAGYELLLRAGFSATHRLHMPDGSTEPLHPHDWRVEVFLAGDTLDASGLVADFTALQSHLGQVIAALRDTHLNALPAFADCNPSTEMVARHIHDCLAPRLPQPVLITKVRVWETDCCAAAYLPGDTAPRRSD